MTLSFLLTPSSLVNLMHLLIMSSISVVALLFYCAGWQFKQRQSLHIAHSGLSKNSVTMIFHRSQGVLAALRNFFNPRLSITDDVLRQLPFYLETLALCLEAGMNLQNALKFSTRKSPEGPLKKAFNQVSSDMRTGRSAAQSWREMTNALPQAEIAQLIALLIQAEQFGLSLAPILQAQADQCRQTYFAGREKQALEAPVKMLLPLILFIFPCSFIVLFFPIAHQLTALWQ